MICFFPGTPVLFTIKSDRRNIAEILLKEKPNYKQYIFESQDLHIFIIFCLFGDIPDKLFNYVYKCRQITCLKKA